MLMDWLRMLLPGVVIMFVNPRLMRWIERSRLRVRPASEARSLVQPRAVLTIGLGFLVAAAVFRFAMFESLNVSENSWLYGAVAVFLVPGLWLIAEYYLVRHELKQEGMQFKRLFGRPGEFSWNDVEQVSLNKAMGWYRIVLRSGDKVRISFMLMGLPEFARMLLSHVPRARVSPAAHTMLQDAAQNKLRPLWP